MLEKCIGTQQYNTMEKGLQHWRNPCVVYTLKSLQHFNVLAQQERYFLRSKKKEGVHSFLISYKEGVDGIWSLLSQFTMI
jgi:hypothetical protein